MMEGLSLYIALGIVALIIFAIVKVGQRHPVRRVDGRRCGTPDMDRDA